METSFCLWKKFLTNLELLHSRSHALRLCENAECNAFMRCRAAHKGTALLILNYFQSLRGNAKLESNEHS